MNQIKKTPQGDKGQETVDQKVSKETSSKECIGKRRRGTMGKYPGGSTVKCPQLTKLWRGSGAAASATPTQSSLLTPVTQSPITPRYPLYKPYFNSSPHTNIYTMALFGSGSSSSQSQQDTKAAIIKQVQAEAAVTNARALISVCLSPQSVQSY